MRSPLLDLEHVAFFVNGLPEFIRLAGLTLLTSFPCRTVWGDKIFWIAVFANPLFLGHLRPGNRNHRRPFVLS
jgi:hypothetical protein